MALFGLPILAIAFAARLILAITVPRDSTLARVCGSRLLTRSASTATAMW